MSLLEELVKEIESARKHVQPVGVHSYPNVYGPNGLFGVSGLERDVISSRVTGPGLASALPAVGSVTQYPLYPYITGKQPASGSQALNSCDDAPSAGQLMTCLQTAQFGLYMFSTRELELNTIGARVDAGERMDLRFVNDPLVAPLGNMALPGANETLALRVGREVLMRFVEVGMDFQEVLSTQVYTGTGLGNEFPGLELLVVKEHFDAKTGVMCDSLASDVRDFNDVDITTAAGAAALVDQLVGMYRSAVYKAQRMGLAPVTFAFVMRDQVFTTVSDIWPCAYMTSGCIPTNENVSVNINTDEQLRMRVAMQERKFLPIDGVNVQVITDPWMPEDDLGSNRFSSDIYLLPLTIRGNRQVLFWEYFDFNAGVNQALIDGNLGGGEFWIDGGKYLVVKKPQKNFCVQWQVKIHPRLRLETPQLAGRLTSVGYTLAYHWIDPGTSGLYSSNTGNPSGYSAPSYYSQWNPPSP